MAYVEIEKVLETARDEWHSDFGKSMADLTSLREVLEDTPTADVVPREDVAELIKEANRKVLKKAAFKFAGHSDYHGDTILSKLICMAEGKEVEAATPISYESRSDIKREVAREIFEEIDSTIELVCVMTGVNITVFGKYAELKKKYIGDKR